jgi:hypothetical protein
MDFVWKGMKVLAVNHPMQLSIKGEAGRSQVWCRCNRGSPFSLQMHEDFFGSTEGLQKNGFPNHAR